MTTPIDRRTMTIGQDRAYDAVSFIALLATALALGGAIAHALELPNKLSMPRESYFIVQEIYRGWWQLAFVLLVEVAAMLALLVMSRQRMGVFRPLLVALIGVVAAQAVFWIWTYPLTSPPATGRSRPRIGKRFAGTGNSRISRGLVSSCLHSVPSSSPCWQAGATSIAGRAQAALRRFLAPAQQCA